MCYPDFSLGLRVRPTKIRIFSSSESTITSTHHQDLTFTLTLERSDSTFNYPEQQWSFISNYAVTDYSGDYKISLIPCTAGPEQKYSDPPKCKFFESTNYSDYRVFRDIEFFGQSSFSEYRVFRVIKFFHESSFSRNRVFRVNIFRINDSFESVIWFENVI